MNQHTRSPRSVASTGSGVLAISDDGYIRLSVSELQGVPLVHLVSGLDNDAPAAGFSGAVPTNISGYTEWVSTRQPAVTLGWDWQLKCTPTGVRLQQTGKPRSNLMLRNASGTDVGHRKTALRLEAFIAAMSWGEAVRRHIADRYRG